MMPPKKNRIVPRRMHVPVSNRYSTKTQPENIEQVIESQLTTDICLNMNCLRVFVRRASSERCVNKVTLIGRAGADAVLKGTIEHPVVVFNLATNSAEKTEWHRISVFKPGLRSLAENYVKSGNRLYVEGRINYGHITDANGAALPTTSIIAEDIVFLSKQETA